MRSTRSALALSAFVLLPRRLASSRIAILLALLAAVGLARPASSHPMGNFSINHYARFQASPGQLAWRTVFDFAEISTAERMAVLDSDGNGQPSPAEQASYLQGQAAELKRGLSLSMDGRQTSFVLRPVELRLRPGAGGLPIMRLVFSSAVAWPGPAAGGASPTHAVAYRDDNFAGRTGWKEIVAQAGPGASISRSSAAATDTSHELTTFPTDATVNAPSQTEAAFNVALHGGAAQGQVPMQSSAGSGQPSSGEVPGSGEASGSGGSGNTPRSLFTQSIARRHLSPGVMLLGVLIALAFGAVHALSPGHGKTMVAAYLVGTRGTPRHAALLGVIVTVTHTFGVFALGLITLFATNYIVPERLYPVLSALSGLLILGVGFWLLMSRVQDLRGGHQHHDHSHDHAHDHGDGHSHDHDHEHGDEDSHAHGNGQVHSHGGRAHSHAVPEGPVTVRTLVALGVSGGIVPCPEALIVLLAAVKMQRIAYGLLLISAFSAGLAAALIGIGLAVVAARRHMSRWADSPATGALTRYLPIGSAAIITIIGLTLTLQAMKGTP